MVARQASSTVGNEHDAAAIRLGRLIHGDVEPIGRKPFTRALGPFDQRHRLGNEVVEAELGDLAWAFEPVEVAMLHSEARRCVGLHQREGRARNLVLHAEPHQQEAGEARLAGTERPRKRNDVAALEHEGDSLREPIERDEIDILEAETRAHPLAA